jgi:hypothetical protein
MLSCLVLWYSLSSMTEHLKLAFPLFVFHSRFGQRLAGGSRPYPISLRNSHSGPGKPLSARSAPTGARHANCHSLLRRK